MTKRWLMMISVFGLLAPGIASAGKPSGGAGKVFPTLVREWERIRRVTDKSRVAFPVFSERDTGRHFSQDTGRNFSRDFGGRSPKATSPRPSVEVRRQLERIAAMPSVEVYEEAVVGRDPSGTIRWVDSDAAGTFSKKGGTVVRFGDLIMNQKVWKDVDNQGVPNFGAVARKLTP